MSFFATLFNRFTKNAQAINTPQRHFSWEEIVAACYDKQLEYLHNVVKVIYTDDKTERAVILQKPDGLYKISLEKLCAYEEEYGFSDLPGYWLPYSYGSIFDTVERAINAIMAEPPFNNLH